MSHLYKIPKSLDDPMRVVGLLIDEVVVITLLSLPFVFVGSMMTALIMAAVTWGVYKYLLKKGQPASFLLNAMYWHLPSSVSKLLLLFTPSSSIRLFIA
jgi:conjugal transfer pilus assembly protein TraL